MIIGNKLRRNVLVSTDHGLMIVNRFDYDHNRVGHAQWLLDHGNSDTVESYVCVKLLESVTNPVMFDIGANIGTITTLVANVLRNCQIYCFEPQPDVFKILCGNLAINNLHNCHAYNLALGSENGLCEFLEPDYSSPNDFGIFSLVERKIAMLSSRAVVCDIMTLDNFFQKHHVDHVDLLKIDAEGMDLDVLQGARNTIDKHNPRILIEHSDNTRSIKDQICNYLTDEKYQFLTLKNNLLAVPKEYVIPDFDSLV